MKNLTKSILIIAALLLAAACNVLVDLIESTQQVVFKMPQRELFIGSYVKVPVIIKPGAGVTMEDLDFVISAGAKGGQVSLSKERDDAATGPYILLLAGYEEGVYQLQAVQKTTGKVLGSASYKLTTLWKNEKEGPSLWVAGDFELSGVPGATWGGGPAAQPENFEVYPVSGTRQVAVLLLDTKSQRFTAGEKKDLPGEWKKIVFDGNTIDGKTVSTAHYYDEISRGKLQFKGQVFGPVSLPGKWEDYLEDNGNYKSNIWQACATAGDALIDYSRFQHLVCAIRSVDASGSTKKKSVHAHADDLVAKTAEGDIALSTVDIPAMGTALWRSATLAHELGHNLKLGDIYPWDGHTQQIQDRTPGSWALMAYQGDLPHMLLVHKMMLGWIPKNQLKLYNFQTSGGFVDETITLHPVESANPPAGTYSGAEVRITEGLNYYFEYRVGQSKQIGDQKLPVANRTNGAVLGTDVTFAEGFEDLSRRKPVLLLDKDSDGDGPVLTLNQDYEEQDISNPSTPTDFKVTVTKIDGKEARLHVQYGVSSQPDPSIRPWNPPHYQSPDIEVINKRNEVNAKWKNVPWTGHKNTLVARVKNNGKMNAPSVWVDFYVKDYTVNSSGGQPTKIGSVQEDVPAQRTKEFKTGWVPGKGGHFCVIARIRHYQTPGANSVIEATELNNLAQSNYDRFISASASPPSREVTAVKIYNPYTVATRAHLRVAKSTSPLYRTYIEHTSVLLQPKETREIEVMFEYAYEDEPTWNALLEQYISVPNRVSITGVIEQPGGTPSDALVALGGVTVEVVTGRATRVENFLFDSPAVFSGRVVTAAGDEPVTRGLVIITLQNRREEEYVIAPLDVNGIFNIQHTGPWSMAQAFFVAGDGYAGSESEAIGHP